MKINKLLLAITAVLFLVSCSEDESVNPVDSTLILGTWSLTDLTYSGTSTTSGTLQGIDFGATTEFTGTGHDFDLQLTLSDAPGTYTMEGGYGVLLEGTATANGFTIPYQEDVSNLLPANGGTWSYADGMLTLNDEIYDPINFPIVKLDETTLTIDLTQSTSQEQNGLKVTSTVEGTMTFTR